MASDSTKPTRWRPRFSVRTLVVIVTLVCAYAACWGPTRWQGRRDVLCHIYGIDRPLPDTQLLLNYWGAEAKAPLIVEFDPEAARASVYRSPSPLPRRYYFWFFGYVAKLPYERPPSAPPDFKISEPAG